MSKKIIKVSIDVPENFDDCWDIDPSGKQAFHDTVVVSLKEIEMKFVLKISNAKRDGDYHFVKYLETKLNVLRSFRIED